MNEQPEKSDVDILVQEMHAMADRVRTLRERSRKIWCRGGHSPLDLRAMRLAGLALREAATA